jgi:MFS family permease
MVSLTVYGQRIKDRRRNSMENRNILTKILAVLGTLLVWLPIAAPVFFSAGFLLRAGFYRIDYLMPAELFPLVLAGGLLLLWAALRVRRWRALIGWSLGSAILLPVLGSIVAKVTGLADGRIEPTGWQWALVLAFLAGYVLAVIALGVGGVLLIRDLFRRKVEAG